MAELKLGNKYECFSCGAKFYDLAKGSALCPKCGTDQSEAEAKENPLVSQSVRRRRRAELLPDDDDSSDDEEIALPDEDLEDEDLELEAELEGEDLEEEEEEDDDDV
jgi:uncharacterized Zn finger protein (UPF0148 family)